MSQATFSWRLLHTSNIVFKNVPPLVIFAPPTCCDILATALYQVYVKFVEQCPKHRLTEGNILIFVVVSFSILLPLTSGNNHCRTKIESAKIRSEETFQSQSDDELSHNTM